MRRIPTHLAAVLVAVIPLCFVPSADAGGDRWSQGVFPLAPGSPGPQLDPQLVGDGAGGVYAAWIDGRAGEYVPGRAFRHVYAQRLGPAGWPGAGWGADGNLIADWYAQDHLALFAVWDGVLVGWDEAYDESSTRVRHVSGGGAVSSVWSALGSYTDGDAAAPARAGAPLDAQKYGRGNEHPSFIADGAGGAFVLWRHYDWTYGWYAQLQRIDVPVSGGAASAWAENAFVTNGAGSPRLPIGTPAAGGETFLAWSEGPVHDQDIFVSRYRANGQVAAGWPEFGLPVCTASGDQHAPGIAADGAGGAFLVWQDARDGAERTYALRLSGSGGPAPGWNAAGMPVSPGPSEAPALRRSYGDARVLALGRLIADGAGGAVAAWAEPIATGDPRRRLVMQRIGPDGSPDPAWPAGGLPIHDSGADQRELVMAADGAGGVVAAWLEEAAPSRWSLVVKRVDFESPAATSSDAIRIAADAMPDAAPAIHLAGPHTHLAWTDLRSGAPRVFVARVALDAIRQPERDRRARRFGDGLVVALEHGTRPAGDQLRLRLSLPVDAPARLELFDVAGRRVAYREILPERAGDRLERLDVGTLPSGVYLIRITQAGRKAAARAVIVR